MIGIAHINYRQIRYARTLAHEMQPSGNDHIAMTNPFLVGRNACQPSHARNSNAAEVKSMYQDTKWIVGSKESMCSISVNPRPSMWSTHVFLFHILSNTGSASIWCNGLNHFLRIVWWTYTRLGSHISDSSQIQSCGAPTAKFESMVHLGDLMGSLGELAHKHQPLAHPWDHDSQNDHNPLPYPGIRFWSENLHRNQKKCATLRSYLEVRTGHGDHVHDKAGLVTTWRLHVCVLGSLLAAHFPEHVSNAIVLGGVLETFRIIQTYTQHPEDQPTQHARRRMTGSWKKCVNGCTSIVFH